MATNLTGDKIKDTYTQLLHIDDGPEVSEKSILSGNGTATAIKVGINSASVDGDLTVNGSLSASEGIELSGTLPIDQGGTGADTVSAARSNLGLGSMAVVSSPAPIGDGGTGATDASTARSNLGLGTIATQESANVSITGGTITGITPLAVDDGGTGSGTASGARSNLGIGTLGEQDADNVDITGGSVDYQTLTNQKYGSFFSTNDQTTTADTPTLVEFGNTNASEGVSVVSSTDITFDLAGVYRTAYRLQFTNTDTNDHPVFIWQRINGTDVDGTGTSIVVPKSADGGVAIAAASGMASLSAGDTVQIVWATDDASVELYHDPAQTSPYNRPEIPSATFNVMKFA